MLEMKLFPRDCVSTVAPTGSVHHEGKELAACLCPRPKLHVTDHLFRDFTSFVVIATESGEIAQRPLQPPPFR